MSDPTLPASADVLIVGGGLAGLALAKQLLVAGVDFQLVEARPRFGGRIKGSDVGGAAFDMGPAWFWPGQLRMAALTQELNLGVFEQFAQGDLSFEDEEGQVHRGRGYASMEGSFRVKGGLAHLIAQLVQSLPQERLHLHSRVTRLGEACAEIETRCNTHKIAARTIALAVPPRLAAQLDFFPALEPITHDALLNVPTWMAGQAKVVAVYDRPFWREAGLSGDAMSRHGPLVEIHDASPAEGGPYALFGFVGIPIEARRDAESLKSAAVAQLVRLFGAEAAEPRDVLLKDWALDELTAAPRDHAPLMAHPRYGMPPMLDALHAQGLFFCGTEVAATFGGFLEGALEAAEAAAPRIIKSTMSRTAASF